MTSSISSIDLIEAASVRLEGVCELLECAANAPGELGSPGLEILAVQAREACSQIDQAIKAMGSEGESESHS